MTEERIEELKKWHIGSDEDVEALIRIVDAESREEGIDELLQYATERKINIKDSWCVYLHVLNHAAARLKEQG